MSNENLGISPESSIDIDELQSHTKYTKDEIKVIYDEFQRMYPSGEVSIGEWRMLHRRLFQNDSDDSYANYTFHTFDTNNDGALDFREILTIASVQTRGTQEEKLKSIFDMYDLSKNGFITREEMLKILTAFCKLMENINIMCKDETLPERYVEAIYEDLDINKDGKLSLEEFLLGLRGQPDLSKLFLQTFSPPI